MGEALSFHNGGFSFGYFPIYLRNVAIEVVT